MTDEVPRSCRGKQNPAYGVGDGRTMRRSSSRFTSTSETSFDPLVSKRAFCETSASLDPPPTATSVRVRRSRNHHRLPQYCGAGYSSMAGVVPVGANWTSPHLPIAPNARPPLRARERPPLSLFATRTTASNANETGRNYNRVSTVRPCIAVHVGGSHESVSRCTKTTSPRTHMIVALYMERWSAKLNIIQR